ncbi:MAG: fatty acid desaturase [Acidimicrobiia bacterium]
MLMDTPGGSTTVLEPPTEPVGRTGSLKPVIDVIPAAAYENPTWKGLAYFGRDLLIYAVIVWALVVVTNPFAVLGLQAAAALVGTGLFIIGHDVAHGALFRSKRLNAVIGRMAMLPAWHVYEGWVLGHNRIHHAYTVRQGYDFVWHPYTPDEYEAMKPWQRLRHRLEWSWFGAGIYYMREVWWQKMIVGTPPARWVKIIRRDRWLLAGILASATIALGALGWARTGTVAGTGWLIARVLVLPFIGCCYLIGSFVHVHHVQPGIKWYRRSEWTKFKAQMEGTTILRARYGLNFFLHWIMVHIPHHVDMRIPMYNLELAAEAIKKAYPDVIHDEPLRFRDFVRNTRQCKLYDYDGHRWMSYAEARAWLAPAAA